MVSDVLFLFKSQYVLRNVHKTLASRFVDIRVFRFTDNNGNYDRLSVIVKLSVTSFKYIVIVKTRTSNKFRDNNHNKNTSVY